MSCLKPEADIRVCVDMRRANEAIERERHPIPTNEEVLHDFKWVNCVQEIRFEVGLPPGGT